MIENSCLKFLLNKKKNHFDIKIRSYICTASQIRNTFICFTQLLGTHALKYAIVGMYFPAYVMMRYTFDLK